MSAPDDDSEKSFDPTPQKLKKARDKGEIPKSTDLMVAAAYVGFVVFALVLGERVISKVGTTLSILVGQSDQLSDLLFSGSGLVFAGGVASELSRALVPLFALPAIAVLTSLFAQRAILFTPSKLQPKLSRISIISNAKNKFGRSGLFEFFKSFVKLVLYSICLAFFIRFYLEELIASAGTSARASAALMIKMLTQFLALCVCIAFVIGGCDLLWQHAEHIRKNRMSRKEITDEAKDAEGDPHMKQQRRQRAQEIALNQMMADVPKADVVVVNPTHYAVALKWSRAPGEAPVCVAKGVDEIAAAIRKTAGEAAVPIHSDPPTARALHASVNIGEEIHEEHYRAVAAAIRFADAMRKRAKEQFR